MTEEWLYVGWPYDAGSLWRQRPDGLLGLAATA